ncbi:MAG: flagellar hook protein FlgE [Armatimonadetes bacterium]|nr:flagellar hook protein FlgE [Armatimonadota bacterium]
MNRALLSGLSGTLAFQSYIDVLSNNIANANTVGYKEGRLTFLDAFYQTLSGGAAGTPGGLGGMNPSQVGSGTRVGQIQMMTTQGSMSNTGAALDAAIEGQGMFVLGNGGDGRFYSRDGSFVLDDTHVLVAGGSGLRVLGWMAQDGVVTATGDPAEMSFPIGQVRPGVATETVTMGGNLDAALETDATRTATISVYDSLGLSHEVSATFTKTATANQWTVEAECEGSTASGTITFSSADGSVATGGTLALSVALTSGATTPLDLTLDLSSVTQLTQTGSNVRALGQDGTPSSTLSAVSILDGGDIQGEYSDGHVAVLGRVAVANFANVAGLVHVGSNLYQEGAASGQIDIGSAGTSGRGQVRSRQLEMSNVDLTKCFVEVMMAQRGFQASTRVISAANSMLDDVMQLNIG